MENRSQSLTGGVCATPSINHSLTNTTDGNKDESFKWAASGLMQEFPCDAKALDQTIPQAPVIYTGRPYTGAHIKNSKGSN